MILDINKVFNKVINYYDIEKLLDSYGCFHDAIVKKVCFDTDQEIIIVVDDLMANFEGFEEYQFLNNIQLIFHLEKKEKNFLINLDCNDNLKIYDIEVIDNDKIIIYFSPSGKIEFKVRSLTITGND